MSAIKVAKVVKELAKIRSVTDSAKESRPIESIGGMLRAANIAYEVIGEGPKQNVVASIGVGKARVLLNSHFDVVPAEERMFSPKLKDGVLYGRGVADAKGPLAAMLCAFIALSRQKLDGKVILCCVCDEENAGSLGTKVLAEKGIVADYVIAGEPTGNNIIIAEKGFLRLNLRIIGKEMHAAFPDPNANAIILAAKVIEKLQQLEFGVSHKLLGKPSISFGLIQGGNKINIGAGECNIGIDIRYIPGQSEQEIIWQIGKPLKPVCRVEISVISSGVPLKTSAKSRLAVIAKSVTGGELLGVNFGTDARYYQRSQAIVLGPGRPDIAHQKEEYIAIADLEAAAKYYESIVLACLKD